MYNDTTNAGVNETKEFCKIRKVVNVFLMSEREQVRCIRTFQKQSAGSWVLLPFEGPKVAFFTAGCGWELKYKIQTHENFLHQI